MVHKAHHDQMNDENVHALAEVGLASAGIIHEIKNALQGIANALFLLDSEKDLKPKAREWVTTARRELARTLDVTHQTMALVRDESTAPMSVTDVLEDVLSTYSGKIAHKGITIDRRYEFKETIEADAGAVRQVFANIVLNALEAAPSGTGRLAIHTSASHVANGKDVAGVRIQFTDNGPGIPEKDKEKVFEPLFSTKKGKGTGLGLWVTARLIRKQHGRLRLESSSSGSESGTRFSVFFPLHQTPQLRAA
jgi:signal transduction histidine kinase